jgi:hypothetical protein
LAKREIWNNQVLVRSDTIGGRLKPAAKAHMGVLEETPPSCGRLREPRVLHNQRRSGRIQIVGSGLDARVPLEQSQGADEVTGKVTQVTGLTALLNPAEDRCNHPETLIDCVREDLERHLFALWEIAP